MTARSLLLVLPLLGAAVRTAPAQDTVSVDPMVAAVVTGGHWTSEGRSGYYRVIIKTGGSQRGSSTLIVQWLSDPTRDAPPTVVRSAPVNELSGLARLDRPQIGQFLKGWRVWIQVTDPQVSASPAKTRAIDLGPPGELQVKPTL